MLGGPDAAALACRFLHIAALLQAFGVLLVRLLILPPDRRGMPALLRLTAASLGVACAAVLARLILEGALVSDTGGLGAALAALPDVVRFTRFGAFLAAQLASLVLASLPGGASATWARGQIGLVCAAIVLAAGSGHAAALPDGEGTALWVVETLHLGAAGGWLGMLAPLFLWLPAARPDQAIAAVRRFSGVAAVLVGVIAASALAQADALIGRVQALVTTDYGRLAAFKLVLFAVLLGFAVRNRFILTPALAGPAPAAALPALRRGVMLSALFGLFVLFAASLLATWGPVLSPQP
jgi:putative copper export protein